MATITLSQVEDHLTIITTITNHTLITTMITMKSIIIRIHTVTHMKAGNTKTTKVAVVVVDKGKETQRITTITSRIMPVLIKEALKTNSNKINTVAKAIKYLTR